MRFSCLVVIVFSLLLCIGWVAAQSTTPAPSTSTAAPDLQDQYVANTTKPPPTLPSDITRGVIVVAGAELDSADFSDPDKYDEEGATVRLILVNDSWVEEPEIQYISSISSYEDPLGVVATLDGILPTVKVKGNSLNLTFRADKCFTPKNDDKVIIRFGNGSTVSGALAADAHIEIFSAADKTTSSSGVIITALCMVCITFIFLLDGWCEAVISLLQLQVLVAVASTNCAPAEASRIFTSSVWVLWPLSEKSGGSTAPVVHGRMVLNFVFVLGTIFIQLMALLLFGCFSKDRSFPKAKIIVRYPAAIIVVSVAFFQGSMYASWNVFSLEYLGFLGGDSAGTLVLAAFTTIFLVAQLALIVMSVFRVVSKQIYKESTDQSLLLRIVYGGSWQDTEFLARWGVLYADLNGSSFWFIAIKIFLLGISSLFSGFVPGRRSSCTSQYFAILAANGTIMIIMFLRRPFKSMFLNFFNLCISSLMMLVVAAFSTAMTCSRKGETFSATTAWFLLAVIFFKTLAVLVSMVIKFILKANKREAEDTSMSPKAVQAGRRRGGLKLGADAADELATIFALEERKDEDLVLNVAYKPSLPLPVTIGPAVASREVGFGVRGGLAGTEGPSVSLQLSHPYGMCCDTENLYIADSSSHRILRHNLSTRRLSTFVGGHGPGYSGDSDADQVVKLHTPRSCCIGQRCLFVADTENDCIRRIDFASNHIHTIVGGSSAPETIALSRPFGVAVLGHALFISDSMNHRVVMYDLEDGVCKVIAGTGYVGYDPDGTVGAASRLNNPQGLAVNKRNGMLYIADTGNHRVVCLNPYSQTLHVACGISGVAGEKHDVQHDSLAVQHPCQLPLCLPTDVCVLGDSSVLIADGGNARVVLVSGFPQIDGEDGVFRNRRTAHVVVQPNDHFLPRCVAASSSAATYNRAESRGLPQPITFFVSDSTNNIVCYVDASLDGARETVFDRQHVNETKSSITHHGRERGSQERSIFDDPSRLKFSHSAVNMDLDGQPSHLEIEAARHRSDLRDPSMSHGIVSYAGPGGASGVDAAADNRQESWSPSIGRASRSFKHHQPPPPRGASSVSRPLVNPYTTGSSSPPRRPALSESPEQAFNPIGARDSAAALQPATRRTFESTARTQQPVLLPEVVAEDPASYVDDHMETKSVVSSVTRHSDYDPLPQQQAPGIGFEMDSPLPMSRESTLYDAPVVPPLQEGGMTRSATGFNPNPIGSSNGSLRSPTIQPYQQQPPPQRQTYSNLTSLEEYITDPSYL